MLGYMKIAKFYSFFWMQRLKFGIKETFFFHFNHIILHFNNARNFHNFKQVISLKYDTEIKFFDNIFALSIKYGI